MTEQEWLEDTDPDVMLDFMFERASRRKIELYTSGCPQRLALAAG